MLEVSYDYALNMYEVYFM